MQETLNKKVASKYTAIDPEAQNGDGLQESRNGNLSFSSQLFEILEVMSHAAAAILDSFFCTPPPVLRSASVNKPYL